MFRLRFRLRFRRPVVAPSLAAWPLARATALLTLCLTLGLMLGCVSSTSTSNSTTAAGAVAEETHSLRACTGDVDCRSGEYCRFALGACGGTGSCEPRPEICTKEFDPVCGCNQNTYSNACAAASDRMSLLAPGRCGTD